MLRTVLALTIVLTSFSARAQSGYGFEGTELKSALLNATEACKDFIGRDQAKKYSYAITKCNASKLSDDDKYDCFQNASVCMEVDQPCFEVKPTHDAVTCYFDKFTALQGNGGTVQNVSAPGNAGK